MSAKQRPILLVAPQTDFYAYVLASLAQGFTAHGYPCQWRSERLDQQSIAEWAREAQPHAVLEINRALAEDVDWPQGIPHLVWVQDRSFKGVQFESGFGKSDHLYFILLPEIFELDVPEGRSWSLLLPGARADAPQAPPETPFRVDVAVIGYIGPPIIVEWPVAVRSDGREVPLGEFIQGFPLDVLRQTDYSLRRIRAAVDDACRRHACQIKGPDEWEIFEEHLPRTLERQRVVEGLLSVSQSLEIYGPHNWIRYPQFQPHFRAFIPDPRVLDIIYQTSRMNVHNGELLMHFRVMDCMAAGGFILINTTRFDDREGGIHNYFEADRHYGAYPIDDIAPVAKRYLADESARRRIAAEARREVMAAHTWAHRAAQILRDLGLPL